MGGDAGAVLTHTSRSEFVLVAVDRISMSALAALALLASAFAVLAGLHLPAAPPERAPVSGPATERALRAYASLPLSFIPNAGRMDREVRYHAEGPGYSFYFTRERAVLSFEKENRGVSLDLVPLGASEQVTLRATQRSDAEVNYVRHAGDRRHIPTYRALTYSGIWPGVDVVFRGSAGQLKYEFHLKPGADPSRIRLAYQGANRLTVGTAGNLLLSTPLGVLRDAAPRSYQRVAGGRSAVDSRYVLKRGRGAYGFELGAYDRQRPLVIDPGLAYSTFLGGAAADYGFSTAVDAKGSAYVTGQTSSPDFPTTAGAFDTTYNQDQDAFVAKLNPAGSGLEYSTYLGGASSDQTSGIAVDQDGSAYLTGQTFSPDFPTTPGAFDTTYNGGEGGDAFVAKLTPTGSALAYSTYLGGTTGEGNEEGAGIAVDVAGSAYVTGWTASGDFPTTPGAFQTSHGTEETDNQDAFVVKLSPAGSTLRYSTYLGGLGNDVGRAIALDAGGSAYVTGDTNSAAFPTTPGGFDKGYHGQSEGDAFDVFVSKLDPTGTGLLYSTYLGGAGGEAAAGIAVDPHGSAYVTGGTGSLDFPTTEGAVDRDPGPRCIHGDFAEGFITKLDSTGTGVVYSTYLGGSSCDVGVAIAIDSAGSAYLTGSTFSSDFPTTAGALGPGAGESSAFVSKLNARGSSLVYSTYLSAGANIWDIALDGKRDAYLAGTAYSPDFPTTPGAVDTSLDGTDALVMKLVLPKPHNPKHPKKRKQQR
jgi:Beta-propeller repeat